jgi:Fe-S-cluster containining protein
MNTTRLELDQILPLTCSRSGICCHGKQVYLNPYEIIRFASEKGITPKEFCHYYCEQGGIKLKFDGHTSWRGMAACSQYVDGFGCSVHAGRPLACRLYPLGRQIEHEKVHYMFEGTQFPCLDGCPEVEQLPKLTVADYLQGQKTEPFIYAQDTYLEMVQALADIAFMLLLETGLAESTEHKTVALWSAISHDTPNKLAERIGKEWIEQLLLPNIQEHSENAADFIQQHNNLLQNAIQERCDTLQNLNQIEELCVVVLAMALYLARSLGADTKQLANHWVNTAVENGARV